jgi:hypothetical protein
MAEKVHAFEGWCFSDEEKGLGGTKFVCVNEMAPVIDMGLIIIFCVRMCNQDIVIKYSVSECATKT